jgi:3-deoxy-7-phosphoheptulonate synthase
MKTQASTNPEGWYASSERTSQTDDLRIVDVTPLPPPEHLIRFFPIAGTPVETLIGKTRATIRRIMQRQDDRLLVIIGPCSIHDPVAAVEYARRLKAERERYADTLEIVMRVYFEKPRTTVGWKGLINDPYLDETYRIDEGLRIGRQLLLEINRLGMPAGSEFLDVISPQYLGDLIAWGAIGARTTESQVIASWPPACRRRSASRTAPTATSASRSMRSRRPRGRTTSCRCTRTARSRSSRRAATRTAT